MKVKNMVNNNGNAVHNQFIIEGATANINGTEVKGTMFQSYETSIAFKPYWGVATFLYADKWKYSPTTSKYRSIFLGGESTKETEDKILAGEYTLMDLNGDV